MATTLMNINIDNELKDKAQSVFEPLGMDMSTVINALLHKILLHEIPLDIFIEKSNPVERKDRREAFGCLKGKIHVPDDFNEPLGDFMEYMQ